MTYRGHSVLQTLVRAYFSPGHTTGQRFIYSGSADGTVVAWDVVSGAKVRGVGACCLCASWLLLCVSAAPLSRALALSLSRSLSFLFSSRLLTCKCLHARTHARSPARPLMHTHNTTQVAAFQHHRALVRDVSWHPHEPELTSVSWDGRVVSWGVAPPSGELLKAEQGDVGRYY